MKKLSEHQLKCLEMTEARGAISARLYGKTTSAALVKRGLLAYTDTSNTHVMLTEAGLKALRLDAVADTPEDAPTSDTQPDSGDTSKPLTFALRYQRLGATRADSFGLVEYLSENAAWTELESLLRSSSTVVNRMGLNGREYVRFTNNAQIAYWVERADAQTSLPADLVSYADVRLSLEREREYNAKLDAERDELVRRVFALEAERDAVQRQLDSVCRASESATLISEYQRRWERVEQEARANADDYQALNTRNLHLAAENVRLANMLHLAVDVLGDADYDEALVALIADIETLLGTQP